MRNIITLFFILSIFVFQFSCKKKGNGGGDGMTEAKPKLSISPISKFEGDDQTTFEFKVRLNTASEQAVTVDYNTSSLSAEANEDYIAQSGTLTFNNPETQQSIFIEIVTDTLKEGDEEFEVQLHNATNADIDVDAAKGTIRNDDTFLVTDGQGYTTPTSYPGMTLVWADEFDGPTLDADCWTHELGNHGWGNNELQNYTNSEANSYISDGKLIIEAIKESSNGSDYSSARLITANKKEFQYGRIDIRAKLPTGQGLWPALWMLGSNFWTAGWPHCGETDIMEMVGHEPSKLYGTIHWDNNGTKADTGGNTTLDAGIFADEFHVFTIIWDNEDIKWYLDDNLYYVADITPAALSEFHQPFFFIFNVAVGGNWPGAPDATTDFPQRMFVDYIRVFQ